MSVNRRFIQGSFYTARGAGANVGDTSFNINSPFVDVFGTSITSASIGTLGYGCAEPGSANEEPFTYTGITNNSDGSAILTGISTVLAQYPYTQTSGLARSHAGQTQVVLTNDAAFYNDFANKQNDEAISGFWTAPNPVSAQGIATQQYVLNTISSSGSVTFAAETVSGTAGAALTKGQIVYLAAVGTWKVASASTTSTSTNVVLGICQLSTSSAGATSILISGQDGTQSGMSTGTTYYLQNTPGTIGSSPGTVTIDLGVANSATSLYFRPLFSTTYSQANSPFPPGVMVDYAGTSAPSLWLLCDGSAISRTTYASLFTAISTNYGAGDGSTTFNVPDFRSRATVGAGTGTKVFTLTNSSTSNIITVSTPTGPTNSTNNELQNGTALVFNATVLGNLTSGSTYYVIRQTYNTFKLATTLANAIGTGSGSSGTSTAISLSGAEAGSFTLTYSTRTVGDTGGEENHNLVLGELPSHTHIVPISTSFSGGSQGAAQGTNTSSTLGTNSSGGSTGHNLMLPFGVATKIIKI